MKNFFVLGIVFFMAFITGCERVSGPAQDIVMAPEAQDIVIAPDEAKIEIEVLEQIQTLLQHPQFQDEERAVASHPLGNNAYLLAVGMPNADEGRGTVHIFDVSQNGAQQIAEILPNDPEALKFGRIVLIKGHAGDAAVLFVYFNGGEESRIQREIFWDDGSITTP